MGLDSFTRGINKVIEMLMLRNPLKTMLGLLSGYVIYGTILSAGELSEANWLIKLSEQSVLWFCAIGVLSFNLFSLLKKPKFEPTIEGALEFIEKIRRDGNLSEVQQRQMYIKLFNQVLEQAKSNFMPIEINIDEEKLSEAINSMSTSLLDIRKSTTDK